MREQDIGVRLHWQKAKAKKIKEPSEKFKW